MNYHRPYLLALQMLIIRFLLPLPMPATDRLKLNILRYANSTTC